MFSFLSSRGWNHTDWRVRERVALRLSDRAKLLQLALTDVAAEVRVAAVKSMGEASDLLEVVRSGACEKSRHLALSRLDDPALLVEIAGDATLPAEVRTRALLMLPDHTVVDALYAAVEPAPFRAAVTARLANQALLGRIAADDLDRDVRLLAMQRLTDQEQCFALLARESDVGLRRALSERLHEPALLREALADEDDVGNRIVLIERIEDDVLLAQVATTDTEPSARKAAICRIRSSEVRRQLAGTAPSPELALAALTGLTSAADQAAVALVSNHESVRWEALRLIDDLDVVRRIRHEATAPEIRWMAARRAGELPTAEISQVTSPRVLRLAIEAEPVPEVARWMIGHLSDRLALEGLAASSASHLALPAKQRLAEKLGPYNVRFVRIPERPYEMSVFLITARQLHEALGGHLDLQAGENGDLPATGLTPELALQFCAKLTETTGSFCRLPSFEEWLHACLSDDETWFERRGTTPDAHERMLQAEIVPINLTGPRTIQLAWPNPWGLLDMLGNVACWIEGTPQFLIRQPALLTDRLAAGPADSPAKAFATAAGLHWADQRIRRGRLERVVRRSNLVDYAADKIGFRVIREDPSCLAKTLEFKLTLLPETAAEVTTNEVIDSLQGRILGGRNQARSWYQVAPVVVIRSAKYEEVRRLKVILEEHGARTKLTWQAAG